MDVSSIQTPSNLSRPVGDTPGSQHTQWGQVEKLKADASNVGGQPADGLLVSRAGIEALVRAVYWYLALVSLQELQAIYSLETNMLREPENWAIVVSYFSLTFH